MGEMITASVTWSDFFLHQHFDFKMKWPWPHPTWLFASSSLFLLSVTHTHTHTLGEVDHYNSVSTFLSHLAFIIINPSILLLHKFPTQPLLLWATSLLGWLLIKSKSLTSSNGCKRGKQRRAERRRGRVEFVEQAWSEMAVSLWVSSSLITKVGLRRSKHFCFRQQRNNLIHFLWIWFYAVYNVCGEIISVWRRDKWCPQALSWACVPCHVLE